ncbi:MAG: hypothetical protein ACU4F9_10475 [Arcticibacter sp.]
MMKIKGIISNHTATKWLFLLNIVIGGLVFYVFRNNTGGDTSTYIGLADGILHGQYSYWYFTGIYFPDTFRNPGYPLFISIFRLFTDSILLIQLFQFFLYAASIFLILQIIEKMFKEVEIKNIFLLLLIPSIYIVPYAAMIFPEILVTFLMLLVIRILLMETWSGYSKYLILGLLFGVIFQIRPVILFLPFLIILVMWMIKRNDMPWIKCLVMVFVFLLSMMPYGLWNYKNHGHFKVTSLEGGGGVFHLGYWAMKLPDVYEGRYWNNYCVREMIPMIDEGERDQNIIRYNLEWDRIDSIINPLLSSRDTLMMSLHAKNQSLFETNNSAYVMKREEVLKDIAVKNILSDFPWYLKAKIYTSIRLWVTGISEREMKSAGPAKKIFLIYPFLITFITFLLALILIPMLFFKNRDVSRKLIMLLVITLYFGIMHIPFTIQARYTIPVRFELLMMISVSIYYLFLCNKNKVDVKNVS